jgi:hypothetical protein
MGLNISLCFPFVEENGMYRRNRLVKIPTGSVVLGVVFLAGIVFLTFGYLQRSEISLIIGLVVIGAGVLSGIIGIAINGKT